MTKVQLINVEHLKKSTSQVLSQSFNTVQLAKAHMDKHKKLKKFLKQHEPQSAMHEDAQKEIKHELSLFKKNLSSELNQLKKEKRKKINQSIDLLKPKKKLSRQKQKSSARNKTGFI